ncbi:MAG: hypothetical protein AAF517_28405, partial [Planctomycetota bacterium]
MSQSFQDAEEYLAALRAVGWFEGLPADLSHDAEESLRANFNPDQPWRALGSFEIDHECIYDRGDYRKLLEKIAAFSFGGVELS